MSWELRERVAWVPVKKRNPFGHAHGETLYGFPTQTSYLTTHASSLAPQSGAFIPIHKETAMFARFCPEIVYACSPETCRPWHGAPGGELLLRTSPLPRAGGAVRVSVRVELCGERPVRRRFTLRPCQVSEVGWLIVRLPKTPRRALLALRLCVGATAGPAKRVLVMEAWIHRGVEA